MKNLILSVFCLFTVVFFYSCKDSSNPAIRLGGEIIEEFDDEEESSGANPSFKSTKPIHDFEPYENIPNSTHCKHCGRKYSEGNHY